MQVNTYLSFSGNCAEALQFYADTLGGKIAFMMTIGESPMADQAAPEMKDKIMHGTVQLPDGGALMGADHPEGKKVQPAGFSVSLSLRDKAEAERIFRTLSGGGTVQVDFQPTFWAKGFGMCTDKYHVPWMVNCE